MESKEIEKKIKEIIAQHFGVDEKGFECNIPLESIPKRDMNPYDMVDIAHAIGKQFGIYYNDDPFSYEFGTLSTVKEIAQSVEWHIPQKKSAINIEICNGEVAKFVKEMDDMLNDLKNCANCIHGTKAERDEGECCYRCNAGYCECEVDGFMKEWSNVCEYWKMKRR